MVTSGYLWLLVTLRNNFYWLSWLLMVIDGYLWLLMCISIVQWLSWLSVVTSGYLWLLVTLRNNFYIFQDNGHHGY